MLLQLQLQPQSQQKCAVLFYNQMKTSIFQKQPQQLCNIFTTTTKTNVSQVESIFVSSSSSTTTTTNTRTNKIWNQQMIGRYKYCSSRTTGTGTFVQQPPPPSPTLKSLLLQERYFGTQRRQRRQPTYSKSNTNSNSNSEYWDKVYKKSKEQLEQMKINQHKVLRNNEPKSLNDMISWKVLLFMAISPLLLCLMIPELRTPMIDSFQQFIPTSYTIDTDNNNHNKTDTTTTDTVSDTTANTSSSSDTSQ
jgi:hypothetical protein